MSDSRIDKLMEQELYPLDPAVTRRVVRKFNDLELLEDNLKSRVTERRTWLRMNLKPHFAWPKIKARARLMEAAGELRFLANALGWRSYYRARNISTRCVSRLCAEDDTAAHAKECPFMERKWEKEYKADTKKRAQYYVELNRERRRRFDYPIL